MTAGEMILAALEEHVDAMPMTAFHAMMAIDAEGLLRGEVGLKVRRVFSSTLGAAGSARGRTVLQIMGEATEAVGIERLEEIAGCALRYCDAIGVPPASRRGALILAAVTWATVVDEVAHDRMDGRDGR